MNRKFISKSNSVLREILNQENNIDILKDFIGTILNIEIDKINLNKSLDNDEIFQKDIGIANVIIITDENQELNIGIQIIDGYYIQNKMILYYAQLHSNQIILDKIIKTITINIIDSEYFNTGKYHEIIKVKTFDTNEIENIGEIHVLELPKFKNNQISTKEEAWISYLKESNLEIETKEKYEKIEKLDNALNKYWQDEKI